MRTNIDTIQDFATFLLNTNEITFCHGMRSYDWETGQFLQKQIHEKGEYESKILDFTLSQIDEKRPDNNALIIIGGIGTGKSTLLDHLSERIKGVRKLCAINNDNCTRHSLVIRINFDDWSNSGTPNRKRDAEDKKISSITSTIWNYYDSHIEAITQNINSVQYTDIDFFYWLLKRKRLRGQSIDINKFLSEFGQLIKDATSSNNEESRGILEREFRALINILSSRELCLLKIYKLKFLNERRNCKCAYLVIDNLDHLDPSFQIEAARIILLISSLLKSKTIIALRPLTYEHTIHGNTLIQAENHYSPQFEHVLEQRVEDYIIYKKNLSDREIGILRNLSQTLKKNKALKKALYATSGLSIRYAIRNFSNFLLSSILRDFIRKHNEINSKLRISEIIRAFFFSDAGGILPKAYQKLYTLKGDLRDDHLVLKPRILDYLNRCTEFGRETIKSLHHFLKGFGYFDDDIKLAINDLLVRSRPLLWCDAGLSISSLNNHANVMLTPIGRNYINALFGEYFYDEVIMAESDHHMVHADDVYIFHKRFSEQDIRECDHFINTRGDYVYKSFYPNEICCISTQHWKKVQYGLTLRLESSSHGIPIDIRENWIEHQIKLLTSI